MREKVTRLVESLAFQNFILAVILINAVTIGFQTTHLSPEVAHALAVFDNVCLAIYIVEVALKLIAWHGDYFRNGWNIFDFTIVVLCCIPTGIIPFPVQVARVLRVLRVFRVLRLVSMFREMRIIIEALGRAVPGVAWTALLLIIVYYVFAVIGTNMFGEAFPEWFGDLGKSFYTLFQVMTLESWSMGISRPVMEVFPWAWAYFVPFVIISAFVIVNIVVGIIVDVVDQTHRQAEDEDLEERRKTEGLGPDDELLKQIALLKEQVARVDALVALQAEERRQEKKSAEKAEPEA